MGLIFAVCLVVGQIVAKSFVDNTDLQEYLDKCDPVICYCDIGYDEDTNVGFLDSTKIQDISDLTSNAEVIKGHLVENKKSSIYYECVLSEVEIDDVYVGGLQKGEHIYVFEPVDCRRNQLDCTDGYSLMNKKEEYVLFLSKLKNAGYGEGEYVYAPKSTTFGKFLYKDSVPTQFSEESLEEPDQMIPYSKCKKEEVYLYDGEMYNKYCRLKKQVLEFVK